METLSPSVLDEFLTALDAAGRRSAEHVVFVHVPKSAGTAMNHSAREAGWGSLELDGLIAAREGCPHCGHSRCGVASRWCPRVTDLGPTGTYVSVGHRPIAIALLAADALACGGGRVRVVMTVRTPEARLGSLFRFYWRNALAGGAETLGRAAGTDRRRRAARALLLTAARTQRGFARPGRHRTRVDRNFAIDSLDYSSNAHGRLVIDAERWVRAFDRHGPGVPYWLDEFVGTPDRLVGLRDSGRVDVIASDRLDEFTQEVFGRPSTRRNVTAGAEHPAVAQALRTARAAFDRVAARDRPFHQILAEAGA